MEFDDWKEEPYESLEDAFLDIQVDFEIYYAREKKMSSIFPTFSAMFRKLGNWLKSQERVEAYVVGECLYWEA